MAVAVLKAWRSAVQDSGEERTEQRRQGPGSWQTQCPRGKGEPRTNTGCDFELWDGFLRSFLRRRPRKRGSVGR